MLSQCCCCYFCFCFYFPCFHFEMFSCFIIPSTYIVVISTSNRLFNLSVIVCSSSNEFSFGIGFCFSSAHLQTFNSAGSLAQLLAEVLILFLFGVLNNLQPLTHIQLMIRYSPDSRAFSCSYCIEGCKEGSLLYLGLMLKRLTGTVNSLKVYLTSPAMRKGAFDWFECIRVIGIEWKIDRKLREIIFPIYFCWWKSPNKIWRWLNIYLNDVQNRTRIFIFLFFILFLIFYVVLTLPPIYFV